MLESIKNALGEELSKQVEAKLQEAKIELAVMNDGSVVKAEKHDTLKADYNNLTEKYQTDISESNSKLESAIANAADYDSLKGTLETLKTENTKIAEQHKTELLNIKKMSAVDVALLEANIDKDYKDMVKSQMNMDALTFDGDNLVGLTDSVKSAQEKFPKLFGEVKKMGTPPDSGVNPQKTNTYKSRYQEALAANNNREAIKIKQEAFANGESV